MNIVDVNLSTIKLMEGYTLRIPPREEKYQQQNYKQLFDYNTLFADIFMIDGAVELVGPPLLNLQPLFEKAKIFLDGKEYSGNVKIESIHRKCRITIPTTDVVSNIKLIYENCIFDRSVQPNYYGNFDNCNVLVTQSRDNPIEWIIYWIIHHMKHHNIDSVIIYDNNSILYTTDELKRKLSKISGLKNVCIINWDIPYGVTGGEHAMWDSDFGQYQSWEHAYSRFLKKANCVIIGDIDELVVHKDGIAIPDILDSIESPVIKYKRRQIIEIKSNDTLNKYHSLLPIMHCHTHLYEKNKPLWAPKYAFKPKKLSVNTHLLVHDVIGSDSTFIDGLLGRHFGALRIHWRQDMWDPIPLLGKESVKTILEEDLELLDSFKKIDTEEILQYLD